MFNKGKKSLKLSSYKRKQEFNIGILVFVVIFIYIVVTIFIYATSNRVTPYEVRQGRILTDHTFTGVAIREELIVTSESNGYIYYLQNSLSKVGAGTELLAVSRRQLSPIDNITLDDDLAITNENHMTFVYRTQGFMESFDPQRFSSVYTFRNELNHSFHGIGNKARGAQLDAIISQDRDADVFGAPRDGVLVLRIDGMEGITKADVNEQTFLREDYQPLSLSEQNSIGLGDPKYKLVTDENWYIIIQIPPQVAERLEDLPWARIRFQRDNIEAWATPYVFNRNGEYFASLFLNHSMIRYAEERFINLELVLDDTTGLKIPRSAVTEKELYRIPGDFIATRGAANGVLVRENGDEVFIPLRVYNRNINGDAYINPVAIPNVTTIVMPYTGETLALTINRIESVTGVFNINQGYAIFMPVYILTGNEEYYIVQDGNAFSLSNFDFIALDGSEVVDGEIVAR